MEVLTVLKELQGHFDEVAKLPIVYWPVNFLVSFIASCIFYGLFSRFEITKSQNEIRDLQEIGRRPEQIERVSISDILYYAGGTGLLATALTSLKFREVDLTAAIFFSVIGPFVLKNMILGQLQQEIRSNTTTAVKERKDRSVRKATGKQGLNRAKQDLKAKGLSETTQGTEAADERPQ